MSRIRHKSHVIGEVAQLQIALALTQAGCAVKLQIPDYGEDFLAELPFDGELHGLSVFLQVKGTRNALKVADRTVSLKSIDRDLLGKWGSTPSPVALISWNILTQEGYYAFVNSPFSYQCNVKGTRKSRLVVTTTDRQISANGVKEFMKEGWMLASLLAQAADRTLFRKADTQDVERLVIRLYPMLEDQGLLTRTRVGNFAISDEAGERLSTLVQNINRLSPDVTPLQVVQAAVGFLVLTYIPTSERLDILDNHTVYACFHVLSPLLHVKELEQVILEFRQRQS